MKNPTVILTCEKCRHQVRLAPDIFEDLFDKISTAPPKSRRAILVEVARRLKCSECGAKAARITKEPKTILAAHTSRPERTCKSCQRDFVPPKFELRSRIGICSQCQELLIAKENEGKVFSSESGVRKSGRFIDNLPAGARMRENTPSKREDRPLTDYDIPDYEEGTPRPGWCSDSDWKKMRSRHYSDMKKRQRGD